MDNRELAKYIDHTLLKADATTDQIKAVCEEAKAFGTASVCVNSCRAALVTEQLKGSDVKTCCVVGFPLGAMTSQAKAFEADSAINAGAKEIDMVINVGACKEGDWDFVKNDIRAVRKACSGDVILKVIIETCLLTDDEKVKACLCAKEAGAEFVKTSTGFSTGGATVEDIALMRKTVGPEMGVKASGGIRSREAALAMIEAGATRIGASSSKAILG